MNYEILNIEVFDAGHESRASMPSDISVLVEVQVGGMSKPIWLDYQTTNTCDAGAIDTSLAAYRGTSDWEDLRSLVGGEGAEEMAEKIYVAEGLQDVWLAHIEEEYVLDTEHFGGMDANSCVNKMTPIK